MKIRLLSTLLIVSGIMLLVLPRLSAWYYDRQQQALVEQWQAAFTAVQAIQPSEEKGASGLIAQQPDIDANEEELSPIRKAAELDPSMEGMLYIDKLDLQLPILTGATEQNLKTTAASIADTGRPGEVGNYAIAGHRNHAYGRNFNRLDELSEGDVIDVDTGEHVYRYGVTEKLYVEPHEVWVLEPEGTEKEITLVTCHPIETGTHRLIVKGKLIES